MNRAEAEAIIEKTSGAPFKKALEGLPFPSNIQQVVREKGLDALSDAAVIRLAELHRVLPPPTTWDELEARRPTDAI